MSFAIVQSPSNKGKNYTSLHDYLGLHQHGKIQCEYIWIGGSGLDIRSKTRTLAKKVTSLDEIPCWNYDGSSTGQAQGHYSEIWLKPIKFVPDPFRRGDNILCLCETLDAKTMKPIETNLRCEANKIFSTQQVREELPWFGIEQEYTLLTSDGRTPLGWPNNGTFIFVQFTHFMYFLNRFSSTTRPILLRCWYQ